MPRGESGRITAIIDPELKQEFYETLDKEGISFKKWILDNINNYLSARSQLKLFSTEEKINNQKGV